MQKGKAGAADGTEISAEAELKAGKKTIPHVTPQILSAKANDLRAVRSGRICKKRNDRFRNELNTHGDHKADRCGKQYGAAKGLHCPFRFSSADILCAKCGNRGKHRGRDQEQKAHNFLYNADCRRIVQTAVIGAMIVITMKEIWIKPSCRAIGMPIFKIFPITG